MLQRFIEMFKIYLKILIDDYTNSIISNVSEIESIKQLIFLLELFEFMLIKFSKLYYFIKRYTMFKYLKNF